MDASFTALLNKGIYDVEEICTQSSQQQDPAKQKKGRRSKNFTMEEDMLLISGWLNVSLDPVQGSNQTQLTYWTRIWNYFNEHKNFASDRTPTSLCNRWCAIQTSVSKFIGYYNQINGRNQSGVTEQDKDLFGGDYWPNVDNLLMDDPTSKDDASLNFDDMFDGDFWSNVDNLLMDDPMSNDDAPLNSEGLFDAAGSWPDKYLEELGQVSNNVQEQQQQQDATRMNMSCMLGKRPSSEAQEAAGPIKKSRI